MHKELLPLLTEGTPIWEKVYLATKGVTDLRGLGLGVWRGNVQLTKEEIAAALIPPKPKPKTRLQKEAEAFAHIEEFGYTGTYPTYEKKHKKMMGVKK